LLAIMRPLLAELAPGVRVIDGPLADGQADQVWDVIMIEGAVRAIPAALATQLRHSGGRLVTVMNKSGGPVGTGVLAEPSGAGLREHAEFDCETPLLRPLVPAPRFQF